RRSSDLAELAPGRAGERGEALRGSDEGEAGRDRESRRRRREERRFEEGARGLRRALRRDDQAAREHDRRPPRDRVLPDGKEVLAAVEEPRDREPVRAGDERVRDVEKGLGRIVLGTAVTQSRGVSS